MAVAADSAVVVKVGGSLHDLPRLGERLRQWLDRLLTRRVLLVAGGGPAADWVRQLDCLENLGEERAHWLALRALSFTARVLAARLDQAVVIDNVDDRQLVWQEGRWPILDVYHFAAADEARPGRLPHLWDVTSDSLAARAALVAGIPALCLLKSVALPPGCTWMEAARQGIVDAMFPQVAATAGEHLQVSVVNFRQEAALLPHHTPGGCHRGDAGHHSE
jgi:aspartokinase-like uncharacterized kinase